MSNGSPPIGQIGPRRPVSRGHFWFPGYGWINAQAARPLLERGEEPWPASEGYPPELDGPGIHDEPREKR